MKAGALSSRARFGDTPHRTETMGRAFDTSRAVEKFTEELESPGFEGGNRLAIAAGMGARSVADLDAFLKLRLRYESEAKSILDEIRDARRQGRDWRRLIKQAVPAQQKSQLSREAVEIATNIGSWAEQHAPCPDEPWSVQRDGRENRQGTKSCATNAGQLAAVSPHQTQPERIILLDDEALFHDIYRLLLQDLYDGVVVVDCYDGNKAWNELSRADPDLLITDRAHTGMSCREMLERLATKEARFPILLISAGVELLGEATLRGAIESLNFSFMHKQFGFEQFRQGVETALRMAANGGP